MGAGGTLDKHLSTSMEAIADWFKEFKIEDIELSISGVIESGGITRLVIGEKGGLKVKLKPRGSEDLPVQEENFQNQKPQKIELVFPKLESKEEIRGKR